jgi:hypothetical protein
MNTVTTEILRRCEGRYPDEADARALLDDAAQMRLRLEAAARIQAVSGQVIKDVVRELQKRYPDLDKHRLHAWGKTYRDSELTAMAVVQSLILGDVRHLDESLLFWFRSILQGLNFTPKCIRDTYTLLRDGYRAALPADTYRLAEPFLERTIEVLSEVPEPVTPQE